MEEQQYSPTTPSPSKPPPPSSILHKVLLTLAFLFLLPLFPTEAPEFLHRTPLTTSWELLHVLLVGIAISYGIFGRRTTTIDSDDQHHKDTLHKSHPSHLQVASVFDDEDQDHYDHLLRRDVDANNTHLWNSRYQREQPTVVLAGDHKPLCLPVRSLRSQVPEANNEKITEGLALPSPIPWTTRSERLEPKHEPFSSASSASPTPHSQTPDANIRSNNDGRTSTRPGRSLHSYSSPVPPPPPPPPVPSSSSASPTPPSHSPDQNGRNNYDGSTSTRLRRSLKSYSSPVPPPPPPPPTRPLAGSRRSLYPSDRFPSRRQQLSKEPSREQEVSFPPPPAMFPEIKQLGTKEKPKTQNGSSRRFVLDSDDESRNTSEVEESSSDASSSVTEVEAEAEAEEKEGNEVDKKADEFIAKFREQIRLQRIASIKRSAAPRKRSSSSK